MIKTSSNERAARKYGWNACCLAGLLLIVVGCGGGSKPGGGSGDDDDGGGGAAKVLSPVVRRLITEHGLSLHNLSYRLHRGLGQFEYRTVIRTMDPVNLRKLSDTLSSNAAVLEFRIVVDRPQWMHREELIVGFGDIFISHQRRVLAPFLAHSSSFHVSLLYSACVRNRRTNTLRM